MTFNAVLRLVQSTEIKTSLRVGFWLNHDDVDEWLEAMLRSQSLLGDAIEFYILPPAKIDLNSTSQSAKRTTGGLIGLPQKAHQLHHAVMATPLLPHHGEASEHCNPSQGQSLWLPQGTSIFPEPPQNWLESVLESRAMQSFAPAHNVDQDVRNEKSGTTWVWLPRMGLVALEASDRLTITDLLCAPNGIEGIEGSSPYVSTTRWSTPPFIPAPPDRIAGFVVLGEADEGQTLNDLSDEIGHKAADLINQSRKGSQKAPESILQSLGQRGKDWLLKNLDNWFGRDHAAKPEDSSSRRPSKTNAGGFISRQLYRILASTVQDKRNQQLQKLLDMTKRDPDKALQFAIPLFGEGGFRGLAVPGSKLLSQVPNFSLSGLSGGGAADFWGMEYKYQQQLRQSYLAMANREAAAGRYRRAAYIHAHLLGNFSSAAGVLEQGGFFREAAQLYRDKLSLPAEQARCLAAAGMFEQAAEIYESLSDFRSSASVWGKAGRLERAAAAYGRAFDRLRSQGNIIEAADLLATKMSQREAAKSLLWAQWPTGKNAIHCVETYFGMLAEDFQHELALSQMSTAIEASKKLAPFDLAKLLEHLAMHYPDSRVHEYAVDHCRVAVAATLKQPTSVAKLEVLQILQRLDQDDQVLRHDCVRYLKARRMTNPLTRPTTQPANLSKSPIKLLDTLVLPRNRYEIMHRSNNGLLAVYQRENEYKLRLFSCVPNPGRTETSGVTVPLTAELVVRVPITSLCEYKVGTVRNLFLHNTSSSTATADRSNTGFNFVDAGGDHYWLSTKHPAALDDCETIICVSPNSWFGLENTHGVWSAKSCGSQSEHLRYWRLPEPENNRAVTFEDTWNSQEVISQEVFEQQLKGSKAPRCLLDAVDGMPIVAIENILIVGFIEGKNQSANVAGTILSLGLWPSGTRKRIAVGHDLGLEVAWPEIGGLRLEMACDQRPYQHVLWMQGGRLFAISDDVLYRFYVRNYEITLTGSYSLRKSKVVSLVNLTPGVCGVCHEDGSIDCF